jgi:hypothetical protein
MAQNSPVARSSATTSIPTSSPFPFTFPFCGHSFHIHTPENLGIDGIEFEVTADEPLEAVTEVVVGRSRLAKLRNVVDSYSLRGRPEES